MIELPYINTRAHLSAMMERYDAFAAGYNDETNRRRTEDPENRVNYQTLKPTHRALYRDLILEIGKKMLQHIKNYQQINAQQGNTGTFPMLRSTICGDGVFICSTNRYQLSKHNAKELSTVYRNLKRLMEAGIITSKVGHGKKSNFELHINAEFLIVSDKAHPEYNPLKNAAETPKTGAFPLSPEIAECKEKKNVQEHLLNQIYSANAEKGQFLPEQTIPTAGAQGAKIGEDKPAKPSVNTFGSLLAPMAGTGTRTESKSNGFAPGTTPQAQNQPENQTGRAQISNLLKQRGIDNVKVFVKRDLEQWHAFHRLSHSAYFVDYLIQTIYAKRGIEIFNGTRIAAIEYAEKYYFPNPLNTDVQTIFRPCETLEDYAHRVEQLKWCIDAANRYAAKNNAYFVLILKYIDIQSDNGLKRTFKWWAEAKKNAEDKARHLKNIREMKLLHETVRSCAEEKITLIQAENFIENNLPKYKFVFRHSLVTVINQLNKNR